MALCVGPPTGARLRLALDQRQLWPAWGAESERIVRTTFDWPIVARQTMDLYAELLGSLPGKPG